MIPTERIGRRGALRALAALGLSILSGCASDGEGIIKTDGKPVHGPERLLAFREKSRAFAPRRRRR